jgi:hypothetical protein
MVLWNIANIMNLTQKSLQVWQALQPLANRAQFALDRRNILDGVKTVIDCIHVKKRIEQPCFEQPFAESSAAAIEPLEQSSR